jgi:hypothetical protein
MKRLFLFFVFLLYQFGFSQATKSSDESKDESSYTYTKFDFSVPLRVNQHHGEINQYTGEKEPFFLFDGLSTRVGYGTHLRKWLALGINTGIDWKANECLVAVPLFATLKLSPLVGDETRIYIEPGYGKSFALGRGSLSGDFQKISLGIESDEGIGFFIELCQYGFTKNGIDKIGSLSLGINYTIF